MLHFIEFGSKKIEFIIKYSTRKTLGIKVSPDKTVKVSVPFRNQTWKEIEKMGFTKKTRWIFKQQNYFDTLDFMIFNYEMKSGYSIFYLGRQYKINIKISKKEEVSIWEINSNFVKKERNASVIFEKKWWKERAIQKISEIALPMMKKDLKNHQSHQNLIFEKCQHAGEAAP